MTPSNCVYVHGGFLLKVYNRVKHDITSCPIFNNLHSQLGLISYLKERFLIICSSMLRWPPVTWLKSDLAALMSLITRSILKSSPELRKIIDNLFMFHTSVVAFESLKINIKAKISLKIKILSPSFKTLFKYKELKCSRIHSSNLSVYKIKTREGLKITFNTRVIEKGGRSRKM